MFPFDGEGSKQVPAGLTALQTQDALQTRRLLEWLLAPPEDLVSGPVSYSCLPGTGVPVTSAYQSFQSQVAIQASLVTGACGGAEDLAAALVQQGYAGVDCMRTPGSTHDCICSACL